jgi:hypothetical protein
VKTPATKFKGTVTVSKYQQEDKYRYGGTLTKENKETASLYQSKAKTATIAK